MITRENIAIAIKHKVYQISYENRNPQKMFYEAKGYLQALRDMELITPKGYLELIEWAKEEYNKREMSP